MQLQFRLLAVVLWILLLALPCYGQGEVTGTTLYVPTSVDGVYGEPMRVEVTKVPTNLIGTAVDRVAEYTKTKLDSFEAVVVVPKNLPEADAKLFEAQVASQLNRNGSNIRVTTKRAYIDVPQYQRFADQGSAEIEQVTREMGIRDQASEVMKANNEASKQGLQDWSHSFRDPNQRELMIGSAVGIYRGVLSTAFWITHVGLNPIGGLLATLDFASEFVFTQRGKQIFDLIGYKLKDAQSPFVKFFNRTAWIRQYTFGVARTIATASALTYLTHLANPGEIASPFESTFLTVTATKALADGFFGTAGNTGLRELWRKGSLTNPQRNYINWFGTGLLGQVGWLFYLNQAYTASFVVTAIDWAVRSSIWVTAKLTNARKEVFVFHPGLDARDIESVKTSRALDQALLAENLSVDELGRRLTEEMTKFKGKGTKEFRDTELRAAEHLVVRTWKRVKVTANSCGMAVASWLRNSIYGRSN